MTSSTLLLLLFLLSGSGGNAEPPVFSELAPHHVSRVVDGDTVELLVDGVPLKVRLIGLDTPETVHPQQPVEHYGKEASTFTRNLLRGESVYLIRGQEKVDRYGRTLGYLYRAPDGLFVNAEIIRQGYGHAYTMYSFREDLMVRFKDLENRARKAGKGLWAVTDKLSGIYGRPFGAKLDIPLRTKTDVCEVVVYATKTGNKYHKGSCRYLKKSRIPMMLADAKKVLTPCGACKPLKASP